jgi:hypothetical protein
VILDEDQRTAVVVQLFDSAEDMRDSETIFDAMDPSDTRGTRASIDRGEVKLDLQDVSLGTRGEGASSVLGQTRAIRPLKLIRSL